MSFLPHRRPPSGNKKHDRSNIADSRLTPTATERAEQALLAGLPDDSAISGLELPWWRLLPAAGRGILAAWSARSRSRRELARVDIRTLRDAGIDPGAALFEANQPFWHKPISLRDAHGAE